MGVVVVSRECGSIFDKLGFRPIVLQIGLCHKGFRAEYGVRLRVGHANPANDAAQFLSLDSPCGWGEHLGFWGVPGAPRMETMLRKCAVLCCAREFGVGDVVGH